MLQLYRTALQIRRAQKGFATETLRWLEAPDGVLLFERGSGLRCAVNMSNERFVLPAGSDVLLTSGPLQNDQLVRDSAAWILAG